jgi:frataxin-like iron-binding protein CyaY
MDRHFHSESSYHEKADDALNKIQDTLEFYFEDNPKLAPNTDINFSSGVLTIGLPHGTWVLNKQTPVRQKNTPIYAYLHCVFFSREHKFCF